MSSTPMVIPAPGAEMRRKLLHWAAQHPCCVCLDTCGFPAQRWQWILGLRRDFQVIQGSDLTLPTPHWHFGAFPYDHKNALEPSLGTRQPAYIAATEPRFFEAELVIGQAPDSEDWIILHGDPSLIPADLAQLLPYPPTIEDFAGFKSQFTREAYMQAVEQARAHIREGDTYELNLAQNYQADGLLPHPEAVWEELLRVSPAPMAGFARWGELFLLSASPERFLSLSGTQLCTEPIKGTAPRHKDPALDQASADALRHSEKERAENVMIVDLSRNDLHRVCETGSVAVPKLFEVRHFPQVHHLVSTITGTKRPEVGPLQALEAAFPPGSMTGAPKVRTCQRIDELERSARGLYAGALGYFQPGGDFDFNVVIRSLVHDRAQGRLSYHVGGAVTWDSDPQAEYEETLVKARGIAQLMEALHPQPH